MRGLFVAPPCSIERPRLHLARIQALSTSTILSQIGMVLEHTMGTWHALSLSGGCCQGGGIAYGLASGNHEGGQSILYRRWLQWSTTLLHQWRQSA